MLAETRSGNKSGLTTVIFKKLNLPAGPTGFGTHQMQKEAWRGKDVSLIENNAGKSLNSLVFIASHRIVSSA